LCKFHPAKRGRKAPVVIVRVGFTVFVALAGILSEVNALLINQAVVKVNHINEFEEITVTIPRT
jgi:hypothetical protein